MGIFDKLRGKSKKDEFGDLPPLPDLGPDFDEAGMPPMPTSEEQFGMEKAGMQPAMSRAPKMPEFPTPPGMPEVPEPVAPVTREQEQVTLLTEDIEEIAEAIINEKWTETTKELDELRREIELANANIDNLHNHVEKIEARLDDMQKAIFEKMESYGKTISNVNVELQAIDRVFKDVMPTFTENVKALSSIRKSAPKKTTTKKKK